MFKFDYFHEPQKSKRPIYFFLKNLQDTEI